MQRVHVFSSLLNPQNVQVSSVQRYRICQLPVMDPEDESAVPSHARGVARGRVKNKSAASVQITAEQLLREAWDRQETSQAPIPRQRIADADELQDYQRQKRREFEDRIIRSRAHIPLWLRYARWEEAQSEFVRARSVLERALDYDHRAVTLWIAYAEMEMRNGFVNRARNIWDRAVAILPRVSQIWRRYAYMEEMVQRPDLARLVFKRWMDWFPEPGAYMAFVKFEIRNGNILNARSVFEIYVKAHPGTHAYLKYARFEEVRGEEHKARIVYERASEELPKELLYSAFYKAFAAFEERAGQIERARAIYKYAVEHLPENYAKELAEDYARFEKQRGGGDELEKVLLAKRRTEYEQAIARNAYDYDAWFDLTCLDESAGDKQKVRLTYQRAVAQVPPAETKRAWSRYIFIWIRFAIWEETVAKDPARAAAVYKQALAKMPNAHRKFSFGKLWLLAAQLEIRRGDIDSARKILGHGIGVMPQKASLYRSYIQMELTLTEVERARVLYRKWIERSPKSSDPYLEFSEMEDGLGEHDRAREILQIGISMPEMDVPEAIWKAAIDLEIKIDDKERAIILYERLLQRSDHLKVWLSYAKFVAEDGVSARNVYERAEKSFRERIVDAAKDKSLRTDLACILETWLAWELKHGDDEHAENVRKLLPNKIKRKRPISDVQKSDAGWEEYTEYVFPEERVARPQLKMLEVAKKWKEMQLRKQAEKSRQEMEQ